MLNISVSIFLEKYFKRNTEKVYEKSREKLKKLLLYKCKWFNHKNTFLNIYYKNNEFKVG